MSEPTNKDVIDAVTLQGGRMVKRLDTINGRIDDLETEDESIKNRLVPLEGTRTILKWLLAVLTVLATGGVMIFMSGCTLHPITTTPKAQPSQTPSKAPTSTQSIPTATVTQSPAGTIQHSETASQIPSVTPEPSPTRIVPTRTLVPGASPNLLANPGFDGSYPDQEVCDADGLNCAVHKVASGWRAFYCDTPYAPGKCAAASTGTPQDETGLLMGRPEYKPTAIENRVKGGEAQQWFCAGRVCKAGVFQVVATTPGDLCFAGAWVQTWSAAGRISGRGRTGVDPLVLGELWTSDIATPDDRRSMEWQVVVILDGDTWMFAEKALRSSVFDYQYGFYDEYAVISYMFVANARETTIGFEGLALWPLMHNDFFIDDAFLYCEGE